MLMQLVTAGSTPAVARLAEAEVITDAANPTLFVCRTYLPCLR
jgi:hypothetical protein